MGGVMTLNWGLFNPADSSSDFGIAEVATRTTTGTQAYTDSNMTSTPVAVMYFGSGHGIANDPGNTAYMQLNLGATDGVAEWSNSASAEDGLGTSNAGVQESSTQCFAASTAGTTADFQAEHSAFGAGSHTLDYPSNPDTTAAYGFNTMFANCDVEVGTFTLDGTTNAQGVASMGFDPDVVIFSSSRGLFNGTVGDGFPWGFGMLTASEQKSVAWGLRDGSSTQEARQVLRSNRCYNLVSAVSGTQLFDLNGSIVAGGFSVTPSAARTDVIGYIALRWASKSAKLVDFQTPTSTGSQAYTGVGFQPEFILGCMTANTTRDPAGAIASAATCAGLGFFSMNSAVQRAISLTAWDDGLTNCQSKYSATALLGPNSTTPQANIAALTSLDSDGFTLNYTTADSTARYGFYLAVG